MPRFFPLSIEEFINWFRNFINVAAENMVILNLTQDQIDGLSTLLAELVAAVDNVVHTKAAAKNAVEHKNNKFKEATTVVGDLNGIFQVTKGIESELIVRLGLHKHDKVPSHEVPNKVEDLKVSGTETGINKSNWDANGNKAGTQYIIEVKYALDGQFQNVDTVTATKYDHHGQKPGVPAWYRITSRRGKLVGEPSNTVGVYT